MILIKNFFTLLFVTTIFFSCGSDDSIDNPQTILEEERDATTFILSNGSEKTWRITEAILSNESETINISNNYNIIDDEFIFNINKNITWRPGFDIKSEGENSDETLLGYYRSPKFGTYNYNENSSTELSSINGNFVFEVINSNTIIGTINYTENNINNELALTLTNKELLDYASSPENGLNFTEVFTFSTNGINNHAPGLIGSYYDNSLYLATRETTGPMPSTPNSERVVNGPERIIKWNLDNSNITEIIYNSSDFLSKQLHITNNQLAVIGGQHVNKYPLDLSVPPNSTAHGKEFSRFGMAVTDNNAYIIGGEIIWDVNQYTGGDKIYKWDIINQSLDFITYLPEIRYGARATIINEKLYIFGGTAEFENYIAEPKSTIYIYDMITGTFSTEEMTTSAYYTYVDRFQNLIYVAGQKGIYDINGIFLNYETILGVYNTLDNSYQDVSHNLETSNNNTIHGICVFNDKIYAIYGNGENNDEWSIMAADLN